MSETTVDVHFSKKYLADYVYSKYGHGHNEPVIASQTTDIGKLIKSLLAKTPANYKPVTGKNTVTFSLPYYNDFNIKVYNYLSPNSMDIIEKYVRNLFNLEIRDLLTGAIDKKLQIKNTIYLFCEQYNIPIEEGDTTYEAIKKDYYRYRKKHVNKNVTTVCSLFANFL